LSRLKSSFFIWLTTFIVLGCGPAKAQIVESNPLSFDQGSSLGEMVEFEKKLSNRMSHSQQLGSNPTNQNENKVLAIYGVGTKLLTDIMFEGQQYRFHQGSRRPIQTHTATKRLTLRLIKIEPPCVRLSFQGIRHDLCLSEPLP
jgi:hypothetical protein